MTSRLRRMLLINTRTSGTECSGAISELDLRGGAAVTGSNGMGKTTTLQLVPLMFGHSPNLIAPHGGSRQPMLRFVLPRDECAIAFEYQRGDEDADVNLIVLRRQANSDAPEYRFFPGPFREELFITTNPGGIKVFVNDELSTMAATSLGIAPSAKLSAAQYRNVFLNLRSTTKDAENLRAAANRFSFSNRPLPHLDRLIASVIKEHVDFRDFTAVAVTMVLDQMGGSTVGNSPGQKLNHRQGRQQIERWLRNRDQAEKALKLKPDVETLNELIKQHRLQVLAMRELRGDVGHLNGLLADRLRELGDESAKLNSARSIEVDRFNEGGAALEMEVGKLSDVNDTASTAYRAAKNQKDFFENEDASAWAAKVAELPLHRSQHEQTAELVRNLKLQADGISRHFDQELAELGENTAQTELKMLGEKGVHEARYKGEISSLAEQEAQESEALTQEQNEAILEQQERLSGLDEALGAAKAAVSNPAASLGAMKRAEVAQQALNGHNELLGVAQDAYQAAQQLKSDAQRAFGAGEVSVGTKADRLVKAEKALESAVVELTPTPGTLLAALKSSSSEAWRTNLARVLHPDLLARSDLTPLFSHDGEDDAYGWSFNLAAIQSPDWVNDEALKAKVLACSQAAEAAKAALQEARLQLGPLSKALETAVSEFNAAEATLGVLKAKTIGLRNDVAAATENLRLEISAASEVAKGNLKNVDGQVTAQKRLLSDLLAQHKNELAGKREEFKISREQAKKRLDEALKAIDTRVAIYLKDQGLRAKEIEAQRDAALTAEGVDVSRLNKLNADVALLNKLIKDASAKQPLVSQYNEWLETNGLAHLEGLKLSFDRATKELEGAKARHKLHAEKAANAERAYLAARGVLDAAIVEFGHQQSELNWLDQQLTEFVVSSGMRMSLEVKAAVLKGRWTEQAGSLAELIRDIEQKSNTLENKLSSAESSLRDFVIRRKEDLEASASKVRVAEHLVSTYDRIGQEVISNVNSELATILESLGAYRAKITSFETEVSRFNNELQKGLDRVVVGVEGLAQLKISIVADFSKVDFIGKLKTLDEVTRRHRDTHFATYSLEVPPAAAGHALKEFMGALSDGSLDIDLSQHIVLSGSVMDRGNFKQFRNEGELEKISSNGLTAMAVITLMSGMLNVIRKSEPVYIPWVTDEVGKFDPVNFKHLITMLRENKIDVITASPALTPAAFEHFHHRYLFGEKGSIAIYKTGRTLRAYRPPKSAGGEAAA